MIDPLDAAAPQRLAGLLDVIATWEDLLPSGFPSVERSSSIAADDEQWPSLPVSHLAVTGILVAIEHLVAVRQLFLATNATFPAADETLLRTALIGSATAAWVLAPPQRSLRVERGLRLAVEDYIDSGRTADDLLAAGASQLEDHKGEAKKRSEQAKSAASEVRQELKKRGFEGWKSPHPAQATTVIREALRELHPDDPMLVFGGVHLWRRSSGRAHARLWPVISFGERVHEDVERQTVTLRTKMTVADLVTSLAPTVLLMRHVLDVYDKRSKP